MAGRVFIISAPSGSGKSTLVNELRKIVSGLEFSVSYTTRPPRGSETEGREYCFVTREQFEAMLRRGEFLEHAEVFGNYYGTSRVALEKAAEHGYDLLLDIDVQGAQQVKDNIPEAVTIFILPPSREELEKRLRRRSEVVDKVKSPEVIDRRLLGASREIENWAEYDYILVNEHLEDAVDELAAIVRWERSRRGMREPDSEEQRSSEIAQRCLKENARERVQSILATFPSSAAPAQK